MNRVETSPDDIVFSREYSAANPPGPILAAASGVLAGATTAVVYALSLPLSGLFTLTYDEQILQKLTLWQGAQWDDSKRGRHLKRLANERAEIIKELDVLRDRYLAAKPDSSL